MKKLLLALALAAAVLVVAAPVSLARQGTTSPAYNFDIHVLITDKGVILDRSVAKRGWLAHFIVTNKSKHAVQFEVGGLKTRVIQPGKKGKVGAYLESRGQYEYKVGDKTRGYFNVV
jgi:hypothetical protein